MKEKIFIFIAIIILILGAIFAKTPETNLLKAILPTEESTLLKVADKYSSDVNVIFEGNDTFDTEIMKSDFVSEIGEQQTDDYEVLLNDYKAASQNLLSDNARKLLSENDFDTVFKNSREFLYNPASIIVSEPKNDPFMLFSDFITSLFQKQPQYKSELNGKSYSVLNLKNLKDSKKIKKIVELQKKYSTNDKKVYLTGAPIHSYITAKRSSSEINVIVALSTIFVLSLAYFYFRNIKVLIPITVSITAGIFLGYAATATFFTNVHILTFVFSTSLIGICIDYSLHFFVENDRSKLFKSLTCSLVTTVAAFLTLLFSNIPLLKQIAIFTSVGLITVYFTVLLFYKYLTLDLSKKTTLPQFKMKYKKWIITGFAIFTVIGFCKVKYSDDITTLYKPSETLAKSEKLLNDISVNQNRTIVTVYGKDIQTILQREEAVRDTVQAETVALSDFIPSISRQNDNYSLISKLYNNKLYDCSDILSHKQIIDLLIEKDRVYIYPNFEKYPFLKNFIADEKTSVMVINSNIENIKNIKGAKIINVSKDISGEMAKHRKTCIALVAVAFVFLFAFLYANYKKLAIKIVLPSLFGILTSIAALGITSQTMNLFHIFAIFLILGFTLDYSIFRVSKIKNSKDVVLISCITTAFSFLMLTFTSFKLISTLGFMMGVGILSAYLFSLILIDGGQDEVV